MTQNMKACLLHKPAPIETNPLAYETIPVPLPGKSQILVKVLACGICRTDLHVVEGDLPLRRQPIIPGHQVVGQVVQVGTDSDSLMIGKRVGIAWLHHTCGSCRFCRTQRENLCDQPQFTGFTKDGGFAEYAVAEAQFVYPLPQGFSDVQAAPLLCAGIIGYRSLVQTGLGIGHEKKLDSLQGKKLGIYGFGAAGHVVIQIARKRGAEVYVITRERNRHHKLAEELGAKWVGTLADKPPAPLDASIIFAPAGELVPLALESLDKGGTLVLGGIHMSPIPELPYPLLYGERIIRTVANNTREDGLAFLRKAAALNIETRTQVFPLSEANRALDALKNHGFEGEGVLVP